MKIAMVGTGYVGLVTGACFAATGNYVVCVDIDPKKIAMLQEGRIPIYEPGLEELVRRNSQQDRLQFTTSLSEAVAGVDFVFIAVGTPQSDDGSADLNALFAVIDELAEVLPEGPSVVIKSTVPVGTNAQATARLQQKSGREIDVASNPEFLKEGVALDDCMKPDRVVVGVRKSSTGDKLRSLYAPFLRTEHPFLAMSPESAEMTKYVANAMLATKISFINEVANVCERMDADVNDVRRGIGHDERIGFQFLFPGLGYGGSCFPKDIRALASIARNVGVKPALLDAVDDINTRQKSVLTTKIRREFGDDLSGKRFAMWGLSFKPRTDDIREAPALVVARELMEAGASLTVHDPVAMQAVRDKLGETLTYAESPLAALDKAEGLVISTEWNDYRHPDFAEMRRRMARPLVFDGRNLYEPEQMRQAGFTYHSIGRASV
ncbi:MAG: UDP-glucose/GDP-mannose dehydrogenase family protein [Pirellulales bacterium]|nr:UDP-glucose/GDP-mannose dehydrogenase family protein [Pirellulales bacterium]